MRRIPKNPIKKKDQTSLFVSYHYMLKTPQKFKNYKKVQTQKKKKFLRAPAGGMIGGGALLITAITMIELRE